MSVRSSARRVSGKQRRMAASNSGLELDQSQSTVAKVAAPPLGTYSPDSGMREDFVLFSDNFGRF